MYFNYPRRHLYPRNMVNFKMRILLALPLLVVISGYSEARKDAHLKEHRVHNIMLYPEKHSWCSVTPIKQVITQVGCQSQEIENNVCVGACFSFTVPRTVPETPGDDKLYYCNSCQPNNVTWKNVILECQDSTVQPSVSKMVEVIESCFCQTCALKKETVSESSTGLSPSSSSSFSAPSSLLSAMMDVDNFLTVGLSNGQGEEEGEGGGAEPNDLEEGDEGSGNVELTQSSAGRHHSVPDIQHLVIKKAEKDFKLNGGDFSNHIDGISAREKILKDMKNDPAQLLMRLENEESDEEEE